MAYINSWTRKFLRSAQLDPNDGASWTTTTATSGTGSADSMYGFTVTNALSPIVFIVGSGCLQGTSISGSSMTFYYACADASTKFYCFDLMADNISGTTFLKTYNTDGRITFNSLQVPLNVEGVVQAPGPGALDPNGRYKTTYVGGSNRQRQTAQGATVAKVDSFIDIALSAGVEFAAFLPWSRSCRINDLYSGNVFPFTQYGGAEGAYGRVGGVSFMFGAAGGTTQSNPSVAGQSVPYSFENIPTDRYPSALIIRSTNLPFPFN
ncbi:hypothetical protein QF019_002486 [Pseudomonas frederiksbergensis]